ncbi:MAG: DUF3857 domain-containing protein [Cellulophaga sp.]|nr:DUF3857 domain-containing protein [Cellulophaga sp.]
MKSKTLPLLLLFLTISFVNAQNYSFGKVSEEEVSEKVYPLDSSAVAAVLYRSVNVRYNYTQSTGFSTITEVHERIKIYKKEGFNYATISELLYISDTSNEKEAFRGLKAYTYNLQEGTLEESKLKSSDTFTEEVSKYYSKEKFTLPNVKEGSVIEYEYTVTSPFYYNIHEIKLQFDIPIKKQKISVQIPEYFVFSPQIKGYLEVTPKASTKSGKITFNNKDRNSSGGFSGTSTFSSIDYTINVSEFEMSDVSALKEEPYISNINNYRAAINYELQYVKFPQEPIKYYTTTWEEVAKTIYDSPDFGSQINNTRYFKEELASILANTSTEVEKMNAIFYFIQEHMNWNEYYSKYTDQGVKKAFKEKTGNVADINLMLVAMLKEAGLKAFPVLVSTKNNGIPIFPTREGFNYVIASVAIGNETILLDATNKYAEPNLIPNRALNWLGRLIKEDGSSVAISLNAGAQSSETNMIQATLNGKGTLEGAMRIIHKNYNAYNFRNANNSISEDSYLEKFENKYNGMEISNYTIDHKNDLGDPITEKFDFTLENQADIIGDKIYFSPSLFKTEKENPFKLEKRTYPIDFGYAWEERLMVNLTIPEGYEITTIPAPIAINLPNNMGSFKYNITNTDNEIKIMVILGVNSSIIPIQDYDYVKEFYKLLVEKETEKVVLSKI